MSFLKNKYRNRLSTHLEDAMRIACSLKDANIEQTKYNTITLKLFDNRSKKYIHNNNMFVVKIKILNILSFFNIHYVCSYPFT